MTLIKRILLIVAILLAIGGAVALWKKQWYNPRTTVSYNSIATAELCTDCEMLIPKKIHRIWTVWDPKKPDMPELYKDFDMRLKALHPDFEIVEWNDEKILAFLTQHYPDFLDTYLSYDLPVKKHDAIRYLIINHFGGIFIQHSIYIYKNIADLLKGATFVASEEQADFTNFYSYEQNHRVKLKSIACGFFASVPNHPILEAMIEALPKHKNQFVVNATGPRLFSVQIYEYFKRTHDAKLQILDRKFVLPFDWTQREEEPYMTQCLKNPGEGCRKTMPEAYGYCLWRGSWFDDAVKVRKKWYQLWK